MSWNCECDIADGTSEDCNGNGTPDECIGLEADCNLDQEADCNLNGIPDECDIDDGTSDDNDGNGIPDECGPPCPWDLNGTGDVGTADLLFLLSCWGLGGPADFNGDGNVGTSDLLELLGNWGTCPK